MKGSRRCIFWNVYSHSVLTYGIYRAILKPSLRDKYKCARRKTQTADPMEVQPCINRK